MELNVWELIVGYSVLALLGAFVAALLRREGKVKNVDDERP